MGATLGEEEVNKISIMVIHTIKETKGSSLDTAGTRYGHGRDRFFTQKVKHWIQYDTTHRPF